MVCRTVHLIEDSEADTLAFTRAIGRLAPHAKVVRWPSANSALEAIESHQINDPDILFIDINLPGMSGFDFLKKVRSVDGYGLVPAMVLTTTSDPEDVKRSFREGASGHLVKPTGFDKLQGLLQRCLAYWFETTLHPLRP